LIVCLKRSWHKSFRFWRQQSAGSLAQSPKQRRWYELTTLIRR
jgi:hypothetical protein